MNRSNKSSAIYRCHWVTAAILAVEAFGVSFGEETKVEISDENCLLYVGTRRQRPKAIEAIIKAVADIEVRDKDGMTSLMWATAYNKNPDVIEVLFSEEFIALMAVCRGFSSYALDISLLNHRI